MFTQIHSCVLGFVIKSPKEAEYSAESQISATEPERSLPKHLLCFG